MARRLGGRRRWPWPNRPARRRSAPDPHRRPLWTTGTRARARGPGRRWSADSWRSRPRTRRTSRQRRLSPRASAQAPPLPSAAPTMFGPPPLTRPPHSSLRETRGQVELFGDAAKKRAITAARDLHPRHSAIRLSSSNSGRFSVRTRGTAGGRGRGPARGRGNRAGGSSSGAVVAREHGIPAVVGLAGATERIVTGQRVTVDGSAGTVANRCEGHEAERDERLAAAIGARSSCRRVAVSWHAHG
ncbi:MAG: hypothetical protein E6J41_29975 [Chloroflexi bacterium]|nr:MAG: hypothetical protein E6J41_29975 [Chloroflexota bacterium]